MEEVNGIIKTTQKNPMLGFLQATLIVVVILGGIIGNLADSVLGATLERRGTLGNDVVNFLNTLVGAITAGVLFTLS